jgi:hypothetical protein
MHAPRDNGATYCQSRKSIRTKSNRPVIATDDEWALGLAWGTLDINKVAWLDGSIHHDTNAILNKKSKMLES